MIDHSPHNRLTTSNVNRKTSYLIAGSMLEDGRSISECYKYKYAKEAGVKIITESQFDDLLYKGKSLSLYFADRSIFPTATNKRLADYPMIANIKKDIVEEPATNKKPFSLVHQKDNTASQKPSQQSGAALWTTKYAPARMNEIIGNQNAVNDVINWLKDW